MVGLVHKVNAAVSDVPVLLMHGSGLRLMPHRLPTLPWVGGFVLRVAGIRKLVQGRVFWLVTRIFRFHFQGAHSIFTDRDSGWTHNMGKWSCTIYLAILDRLGDKIGGYGVHCEHATRFRGR